MRNGLVVVFTMIVSFLSAAFGSIVSYTYCGVAILALVVVWSWRHSRGLNIQGNPRKSYRKESSSD